MRTIIVFLSIFLNTSCAGSKQTTYTASTPAAPVIKTFLGIALTDSIDFIRWKLTLNNNRYTLQCNYGIGKPNTSGFINGGTHISITGNLKKEKNYYQLLNNKYTLKLIELSNNLLHFLDSDNSLLVGNGGWSYTLNNISPALTDEINFISTQTLLKDSMAFQGRTPCVPGVIPAGKLCYKIKWYIVLYTNAEKNEPATWRAYRGKTGSWKIITGRDGRTIYQLKDEQGNGFLYLVKADENILLFADANGKLLTGDEDFSYTLNRLK